jgi:hypothetical protein
MSDQVVHPNHYGGDVPSEPIKVIRIWGLNFALGNAVKYLSRAGKKDPDKAVEDVEKARFYVNDELKSLRHAGAPRTRVVGITSRELEVLVEAMPELAGGGAWDILRALADDLEPFKDIA